MGNSGIKLKTPLTATGSTAPEANLEMARVCASVLAAREASLTRPTPTLDGASELALEAGICEAPVAWGAEIHFGLSSTADAAPPT
ncbi:MAG: hypothetical protein JWN48_4893 [Myxococcaceae bacterium]|nr:hypothetical protein [Myxococcaceae bacterium]